LFIKLGNLRIHYKVSGSGDPIVLLHGWGCNVERYSRLQQYLARNFTVYAIDLPGFGLSTPPEEVWGGAEYAVLVSQFISDMNIMDPVLIGHSLGGKIVINLVARDLVNVKKIVLISSAGVRLPRTLGVAVRIYFFKLIKFLGKLPILKNILGSRLELYKSKFGSNDYRNASGQMRSILVKVINEDVTGLLSQIKVPTLLLWGGEDASTPLDGGKIMQQKIGGAVLKVFPGGGHFPFLDNYEGVVKELDNFLK
jgi:pimeloyl-ACP methyl ester carboxylesterase